MCLLLERQPPILLFDAKKFQPAADASDEQYNSRVQPINVNTAAPFVKTKITSTLSVPHLKRPP